MSIKMSNGQMRSRKYEESAVQSKKLAIRMDELINGASGLAKYVYESFKELQSDFNLGYISTGDYRQHLTGFKVYFDTIALLGVEYHHPDLCADQIIKALKDEGIEMDGQKIFPSKG